LDQTVDSSRKTWWWGSLAVAFLIYLPEIFWSFGHDQNVFAAIGSLMLKGFRPYSELWDVKPPNIFYAYGLAQLIFGRSEISVRLLDLFSCIISASLVFRLIENTLTGIKDTRWIMWAAATGAVLWAATNLSLGLADTAQTETFSQPFLLGAFVLWSKPKRGQRTLFFVGVLLSIATFFKLTNLIFLPAVLLLEVFFRNEGSKKRLKHFLRCLLLVLFGFVLGSAIELLILLAEGSMSDFFRMMSNVIRYHTEPGSIGVSDVLRTIWLYIDLFGVLAIAGIVCYAIGRPEKSDLLKRLLPLIILLVCGAVVVLSQGKGWGYHYQVLLPALIPVTAICFGFLISRVASIPNRTMAYAAVILLILAPLILGPSGRRRARFSASSWQSITSHDAYLTTLGTRGGIYEPRCTEMLANRLAEESFDRDRIFILGHEPGAYWKSDRLPASRFIYTLLLSSPVVRDTDIVTLQEEVLRRKPSVIVVQMHDTVNFSGKSLTSQDLLASDQFIPLRREIETHYDLRDTVCQKFLLYKRKAKSPET
jgi:hypothetical protein